MDARPALVVALGVVVDDARLIDVENILRPARRSSARGRRHPRAVHLRFARGPAHHVVLRDRPPGWLVAFLRSLMMSGLPGPPFFRPLVDRFFLIAVGLSLLVAMSATPALCTLAMARSRAPRGGGLSSRYLKSWQLRTICLARAPGRVRRLGILIASGLAGMCVSRLLGGPLLPGFP